MTNLRVDVAVVGGGPAGAVFAVRMAQLGHRVCLVERSRFPRPHLGESLTPGVVPMLASAGLAPALEASEPLRVRQVHTNWEGQPAVRQDPGGLGLLVDRGRFDAALLDCARAAGVRVLQPASLRHYRSTGAGWRLDLTFEGGRLTLDADFLADASGRARRLGGRQRRTGPRTIAVYGYWGGRNLPDQPRIEAGAGEWYWGVPIPGGSLNTLVFVDAERLRTRPAGSLDDWFRALLQHSSLLEGVEEPRLLHPVRAAEATPHLAQDCVGARRIGLGDAALALDPLSSSGVQKAIQSALAGAIVANTLLQRPEDADAAMVFYRDSLGSSAARHREWAAGHYATAAAWRPDPFWALRSEGAEPAVAAPVMAGAIPSPPPTNIPLALSAAARCDDVPCLGERFVECRAALQHPGLDGPVAFLAGHPLVPLLTRVGAGMTADQLARTWSDTIPPHTGSAIARWLLERGVLEPAEVSLPV